MLALVSSVMITVLTPTYNREKLLHRLAESLLLQSSHDFEWLVVDDGSTDNTKEIIAQYKGKFPFSVRYIYKDNGGKHTALNTGFDEAEGEWIFVVDSDDWLENDCVSKISLFIDQANNEVGAISILRRFEDGDIIGDNFPSNLKNYIDRIDQEVKGDKADIFRKSALDGFRFPVFEGENFMAESPMFIWLGLRYKTDFINYPGYICEYQESGLSGNSIKNRHRCYRSAMYVYEMQFENLKSKKNKFKAGVNWWRFSFFKEKFSLERVSLIYLVPAFFIFLKDRLQKNN